MKRAFTIVELLISSIIIWFLMTFIFKIYINIMNISSKVENEKDIANEFFYVSQNLQNFVDTYKIDFDKYIDENDESTLISSNWFTWNIHLIDSEGSDTISIFLTWDCDATLDQIKNKYCWIQMQKDWQIFDMTDKNKVYVNKMYFKIVPFENAEETNLEFEKIYNQWFWMFTEIYIKNYSSSYWPFDVKMDNQNFYNIRQY